MGHHGGATHIHDGATHIYCIDFIKKLRSFKNCIKRLITHIWHIVKNIVSGLNSKKMVAIGECENDLNVD